MRYTIIMVLFLASCGSTNYKTVKSIPTTKDQVFITDQTKGLPGKCYQKMMLEGQAKWTEVLCQNEITKGLIQKIQTELIEIGYSIHDEELSSRRLGASTKGAIIQFQKRNNLACGGIDWATINMLKDTVTNKHE